MHCDTPRSLRIRRGCTIVEALIAVGLLGMLVQILLPALSAARESARRLVCVRQMQRLGAAALAHHEAHNGFPSGGWHFDWIGEPERGTGPDQPGAWTFNLLDYLDAPDLRDAGRDLPAQARFEAIATRCRALDAPAFTCPSRRTAVAYPYRWNRRPRTRDGQFPFDLPIGLKTDYAANAGDSGLTEFSFRWPGPRSLTEGDHPDFAWPDLRPFTGVIHGRSQVRQRQLRDGASHTYLFGEKYLDARHYTTGEDWGDNECLFAGFNNDNCRSTRLPPHRDTPGLDLRNSFGSAHPTGWNATMADGSVRTQDFQIAAHVHRQHGNRDDSRTAAADASRPAAP